MRRSKKIALILFALIALPFLLIAIAIAVVYGSTTQSAKHGEPMLDAQPIDRRRPDNPENSVPESQILFGDLHVHTNYSSDAFLQSYQIPHLDRRRVPADACNFARFCSQLDFWSINDHAESLPKRNWLATVEAIRACEATSQGTRVSDLTGEAKDPDLVSFLGWEWTQAGLTPETHYGHKNVILADLEDGKIPTRPIASAPGPPWHFLAIGTLGALAQDRPYSDFASFHRFTLEMMDVDDCPSGVAAPNLPDDCRESAQTPKALFEKLDEWDMRALVIPHGLAWGITNPAGARLDVQLEQHDPKWQPLLEVYSGHGNSEVYAEIPLPTQDPDGDWICPPASENFEPCCVRAATLVRDRCEDSDSADCLDQAKVAMAKAAAVTVGPPIASLLSVVPGSTPADWGTCGQLEGNYLSAWNYRPKQSAQYALALGTVDGAPVENRFRLGFIGASDTHRGRPGTGYVEKGRLVMTDGVGYPIPEGSLDDRQTDFYFSGGLAAVHAPRRNRDAIFEALQRRQVYGTSGDRILLWFDYLSPDGDRQPMGSETILASGTPRFEVRAVGAQKQKTGCPDFVHAAMSAEEIESLCLGQCHHPSDERKRITRIEVVRIHPQQSTEAEIGQSIEDPWRTFSCPDDPEGCRVEFEDPEYADRPGEVAYYVRAIQEPTPTINGDPLQCERDENGKCLRAHLCATKKGNRPDDCLAPAEERAWSSPIFLRPEA